MTTVLVTLLAVVVALLVVLVAGLLRSHAEILRALQRLGVDLDADAKPTRSRARPDAHRGSRRAVDITGTTPDGAPRNIAMVGVPQTTMLVFLTSTCAACADFWEAFADVASLRLPSDARLVVVTKGADAESSARVRRLAPRGIEVVMSTEAWDAYGVAVAPHFACVDGESSAVVSEGPASAWDDVASICEARAPLS